MFRHFLLLVYFILLIFTVSCRHDSEQPKPDESPVISLEAKPGYVSGSQIIGKNTAFMLSVEAGANTYTNNNLSRLTITRNAGSTAITETDTSFSSTSFKFVFSFHSINYADTEKWEITIYDSGGNSKSVTLNLITLSYPPSLTVVNPTIPMGTSQPFQIAIMGNSNSISNFSLKKIKIFRSTISNTTPFLDSTISGKNLVMFYDLISYTSTVTETFTVKLEDNNGEINTVSFKIYVASFLLDEHEGIIYNSLGTGNYGWDMLLNLPRTTADNESDIDLYNFTDVGEFGAPYYYNNGWTAGNATRFKRANWYEYENATQETAVDAYTGGTISVFPSDQATAVSAGDIYIVNLRNQNQYCVLKITEVNRTTGDNMDYVRFTYKK
jgi:hypothetical protein